MSGLVVRPLVAADRPASAALSAEAFASFPAGSLPETFPDPPAWRHPWGGFEPGPDGERLVARVFAHDYHSWWHGQALPTTGIAGVGVLPEDRGAGHLAPVLAAAVEEAARRGDLVSTLYPTAPGIYRSMGWEVVGSYDTVQLRTAELAGVRATDGTTVRRATAADLDSVQAVYDAWARVQNGPLTRTGPAFSLDDLLTDVHGTTLAVDPDEAVVGFCSWDRAGGYREDGRLDVHDLVALTADGFRALWASLATSAAVAPALRLRTSGLDPARLVLPGARWDVVERHPYMLRVGDVAGALTAARLHVPGLAAQVPFTVSGDRLGRAPATFVLHLDGDSPGTCAADDTASAADAVALTPQGLALLFAGAQPTGALRQLGHLTGPTTYDAVLDAVLGGRALHVRDYF